MQTLRLSISNFKISKEQVFFLSSIIVSGGNYLYNLIVGRMLGPEKFADAAVLITFLLVFSFLGMAFQLTTARFAADQKDDGLQIQVIVDRFALLTGFLIGVSIWFFSLQIAEFLQVKNDIIFKVFAIGVPFYFFMSSKRGAEQGLENYLGLSFSYQLEMLGRLLFTVAILLFLEVEPTLAVSIGISISLLLGALPYLRESASFFQKVTLSSRVTKKVFLFFSITLIYEFSQIIINNSDLILVKHFFDPFTSGQYASISIIGRMIYFVTWMFVMLLLPKVIQLKNEGKSTSKIFSKYLLYIGVFCATITLITLLFPSIIINQLFGEQYLGISPLLWKYAVAVSLFAKANLFSYYFLSLEKYLPLFMTVTAGFSQIIGIYFFHNSLLEIIHVQIIIMSVLLTGQINYYLKNQKTIQVN